MKHKKIIKHDLVCDVKIEIIVLLVCLLFTTGAAVNQGITGFIFGVPFFFRIIILVDSTTNRRMKKTGLFIIGLVTTLYILKIFPNWLYFPALGNEFKSKTGICIVPYHPYRKHTLVGYESNNESCSIRKDVVGWLPPENKLTLHSVEVGIDEWREKFYPLLNTPYGNVRLFVDFESTYFWTNGSKLREKDMYNPFFYGISFLMLMPLWLFGLFVFFLQPSKKTAHKIVNGIKYTIEDESVHN